MREQLREYWRARSPRDRRIVALIIAVIVTSLFYAYIWMPLTQKRDKLRDEVPKLRNATEQMNNQAKDVASLKKSPKQKAGGNLQEMVGQSAERAGVKQDINQITPLSAERIQVTLNSVSFDKWVRWTQGIASESGLRVESANISATTEPGMVKIQAVFSAPGR